MVNQDTSGDRVVLAPRDVTPAENDTHAHSSRDASPEMMPTAINRSAIITGQTRPERIVLGDALSFCTATGEVKILDGLKPDEAGRKAVNAMAAMFGDLFEEAKAAARLEALEEAAMVAERFDTLDYVIDEPFGAERAAADIAKAIRARSTKAL